MTDSRVRKLFFVLTTEARQLRETSVPGAGHQGDRPWTGAASQVASLINRGQPIDFSSESPAQLRAAGSIATALKLPLLLMHVVEPTRQAEVAVDEVPML